MGRSCTNTWLTGGPQSATPAFLPSHRFLLALSTDNSAAWPAPPLRCGGSHGVYAARARGALATRTPAWALRKKETEGSGDATTDPVRRRPFATGSTTRRGQGLRCARSPREERSSSHAPAPWPTGSLSRLGWDAQHNTSRAASTHAQCSGEHVARQNIIRWREMRTRYTGVLPTQVTVR